MVVNIVDVGWATSKSGCLPISALQYMNFFLAFGAIFAFLDPIESGFSPGQDTIRYTVHCFFVYVINSIFGQFFRVNPVLISIGDFLWEEILLEKITNPNIVFIFAVRLGFFAKSLK